MNEMDKHVVLGILDSEIREAGLWDYWKTFSNDEKMQIVKGMFGSFVATVKLGAALNPKGSRKTR